MHNVSGKTYWIVGASEGLGQDLARQMVAKGARVILSARKQARLDELAVDLGAQARAVAMDIADPQSVAQAWAQIGQIDGLVFLAAVYWPQRAQDWNAQQVVDMLDINLTGAARVLGHVVPDMVARDAGHIVLTSSLSGFRGLPGAVGYGASKAGIMSLAESMHYDLRKTGVRVQVVNPGFIKTRLTDKNEFKMPFIMTPDQAARQTLDHMETTRFKASFPRMFSWVFRASQFFPDWLYYRMF